MICVTLDAFTSSICASSTRIFPVDYVSSFKWNVVVCGTRPYRVGSHDTLRSWFLQIALCDPLNKQLAPLQLFFFFRFLPLTVLFHTVFHIGHRSSPSVIECRGTIFSIAGYSPADSSLDSVICVIAFRFYHFGLNRLSLRYLSEQCKGKITRISTGFIQIYRYIFRICRTGDRRISRGSGCFGGFTLLMPLVEAVPGQIRHKGEIRRFLCFLFVVSHQYDGSDRRSMRTRRFRFLSFFCYFSNFLPPKHYSRIPLLLSDCFSCSIHLRFFHVHQIQT